MSCSSSEVDTAAMFWGEYLKFLYIPTEEVASATNDFSDENLLKEGLTYKGQLLQSPGDDFKIDIVVRISQEETIAINEVGTLKYLKHKNIASVFKFTYTEDTYAIINKYEANGSLDKHLSGPTLTWLQRLHICVGVTRALTYLHDDPMYNNCYVIHGNIKSSKVLLDHNWEPKLHGFAFAVTAKKHHLHLINKYNGSLQYMDPAYVNSSGLTHKSDVFSFGVLLFEVLFGRQAFIEVNDNWYFARLARSHYENRKLDDLIDPDLRKQMNLESLNIFAETAYFCIKEKRPQRPDMNQVLSRLERALELQHKHEHSTAAAVEDTSSNRLKGKDLDQLKFQLSDIELATENFSKTCCIGSGSYGMVYKAELNHFDVINLLTVEGRAKGEPSKKRSTVAIKRIFSRDDTQGEQGFVAEIEMLSKCQHPNIVSLLGFCDEGPEMIIVYEYISNGSLEEYLGNIGNMNRFSWEQRMHICLDIAHGLNYLHQSTEGKQSIIHRDIKSANILLDDNWVAKIADFGLSKLHHANQKGSTMVTGHIAGTEVYLDPEYASTGKLKTKSDVYSFGVVMFEIMCGKLAYDKTFGEKRLPSVARKCFNEGTLEKLIDPILKESDGILTVLNEEVNQDSFDTFSKIAYQCLAETQSERPSMEIVIKEVEKALNFQKTSKDKLRISLKAIKLGTQNFSDSNCFGKGRHWKLYEGELAHANGCIAIVAKRWDTEYYQSHFQFSTELEILNFKYKNIIGLVGYCNEMDENIIVYQHASNGSLNKHLDNPSLTWMKRLEISLNISVGLFYLHEDGFMKHRDIKSGSILLDGNWNAKISNLELCQNRIAIDTPEHVEDNAYDSLGYVDPEYQHIHYLTQESDIYSLGVILIEMLCGRLAWGEGCENHSQSLGPLAVRHYNEKGNLNEMIFHDIKEQIVPQSLTAFQTIAIDCLQDAPLLRPDIDSVLTHIHRAIVIQEDYEIWKPKLPIDYKEIIQMSEAPEIYHDKMNKDIYNIFSKGVLLRDRKVWFSLGSNGERNEMISAKRFSYKNHMLLNWRSLPESRFPKVAEMFDVSKLNIQIKIRTQFLSPCVTYKVHLIFRFRGPRKSQAKRMYVNLKYIMGNERLHAYFATMREDGWMMIELFQFLNQKKDADFEVLLEGFSRCYCGSDSIYIEGILFQAIGNASLVKHEEIGKLKEVQQDLDKFTFSQSKMEAKKEEIISANSVVYNSSNVAIQSRFSGAIECLRQQVLHIKCKIRSQMLSSNTENVCYLIFKLSEEFCGLHGPVMVRNLNSRRRKEMGVLYFRYPNIWNDTDWVPKEREDGWMEVVVWKFNSNHELKNDHLLVNLKLVTYEGTMSGLIVRGITFRPM